MIFNLPTIHTFSLDSCNAQGNAVINLNAATSATWYQQNSALFFPLRIFNPYTVTRMFVHNGSTVSGNIDVGLYSPEGNLIVSIGSTGQSGTSVLQEFNITDTVLVPGLYYMAMSMDNVSGTTFRASNMGKNSRIMGIRGRTTSFPLPADVSSWITSGYGYLPLMGISNRSFL